MLRNARGVWAIDERDLLLEVEPETFHFTAHYKDYPSVLARLETLHPGSLRSFLERRFRKVAKKSVVKAWEAGIDSILRSAPCLVAAMAPVILGAAFLAALGPAESAVRGSLVESLEYE